MPRVSVIIPLYNCAPYVRAAVASVLAQQHTDLEVIVVDDGSTDGGSAQLAEFGDRVRLVKQPNSGVATARNRGLAEARGDFIAFLDADDWWEPSRLRLQLEAFERFPSAGLAFADFAYADHEGRITQPRAGIRRKYGLVRNPATAPWHSLFVDSAALTDGSRAWFGNVARHLFMGNMINTCSVLMRREAMRQIGEFDATLTTEEDYDYWLRLARYWPMIFVDAPLLAFRVRPGQLTRPGQIEVIVRNVARVVERARVALGDEVSAAAVSRRLARIERDLGQICLRSGRNSEARALLGRSLRREPAKMIAYPMLALACLPGGWLTRFDQALRDSPEDVEIAPVQ